jgi:hypothetical protein
MAANCQLLLLEEEGKAKPITHGYGGEEARKPLSIYSNPFRQKMDEGGKAEDWFFSGREEYSTFKIILPKMVRLSSFRFSFRLFGH